MGGRALEVDEGDTGDDEPDAADLGGTHRRTEPEVPDDGDGGRADARPDGVGDGDVHPPHDEGSRDELIVAIISESTDRSVTELRALPSSGSPGQAVRDQWLMRTGEHQTRCERLYVEASPLGLFGEEPYASAVAESNARWMAAVRDHLVASGVPGHRVEAVAPLVDAAFMGFELDLPLDEEEAAAGVEALAEAIELLSRS